MPSMLPAGGRAPDALLGAIWSDAQGAFDQPYSSSTIAA
jgi:hypothetical protein